MILAAAAVFGALAVVLFLAGLSAGRQDVAMLGAVLMIGVGGTGVIQGYEVKTGEDENVIIEEDVRPDLELTNVTHLHTKSVQQESPEPRGLDWSENGTDLITVSAADITVVQYTSGPYDLSTATYNRTLDVTGEVSAPTGVEMEDGDSRLYITDNGTEDKIVQYDLVEHRNISTATQVRTFDVSPWASQPRLTDFKSDGEKFFLADANNGTIHAFTMSDPWNISSASHLRMFDISSQEANPQGMAFEREGKRLLIVGTDSDTVFEYKMTTGYDLSTASYTGDSYVIGDESNFPSAVSYTSNGRFFFVADSQNDDLFQYRSIKDVTTQTREQRDIYTDVGSVSGFPLEIIVLLIGAIMLIASAGEASEQGREKPPWKREK